MSRKTGHREMAADFGFRKVPAAEKARMVHGVFSRVAGRYDLMNDLMSGGLHRLWKRELAGAIALRGSMRHIDMAGGTGDITERAAARARRQGADLRSIICDINEDMLTEGRRRAAGQDWARRVKWLCADAEALPFADRSFDLYTIAFGIRNVTDRARALAEAVRVLSPGGQLLCLEFAPVSVPLIQDVYDRYSFTVIPWLGARVAGDGDSYRYLVESIRRFPAPPDFAREMTDAGLGRVRWLSISLGIVSLHSGWKI